MPTVAEMAAYIRARAPLYNIAPDAALRLARAEGLRPGVWQSNVGRGTGHREPSFGPFQLHMQYMGRDMFRETGVDPSKPENWRQGIDYALGRAAKAGSWDQWYGARDTGMPRTAGIGGRPGTLPPITAGATSVASASPSESVVAPPRSGAPGSEGISPAQTPAQGISNLIAKAAEMLEPPQATVAPAPAAPPPPPAKPIKSSLPGLFELFPLSAMAGLQKPKSLAEILQLQKEEKLYG